MNGLDLRILLALNQLVHQSRALDGVLEFLTDSELLKGEVFLAVLTWYWFAPSEAQARRRETIIAILVATLFAIAEARVLQHMMPLRPRPNDDPTLLLRVPYSGVNVHFRDWSSFPSDHATMFSAMATGLFFLSPPVGLAAHLYWIVLIALPRVCLGLHYPSDVLAGGVLGALLAWVMQTQRVRPAITVLPARWSRASPGSFYACLFLLCAQLSVMFIDVRVAAHGLWSVLSSR
jgi:undecaprenyl-diphosphatase